MPSPRLTRRTGEERHGLLEEVLSVRGGLALPQEREAAVDGQSGNTTILIIEDDESLGEVIALTLSQEASSTPLVGADSDTALAILSSQSVHLLLIDDHVATLRGLALYDLLPAHTALRDIPAIIMSASLERHEQELRKRNLTGLSKPFDVDDLLATIEGLLTSSTG